MRKIRLFALCALLLAGCPAPPGLAQTPQPLTRSQLQSTPFDVGGLTLTLRKLDGIVRLSADPRDVNVGFVVVRLENRTNRFAVFAPGQLVIVGKDGSQASVGYERRAEDRVLVSEIRVAPGAHVEVQYNLTARVRFPAKVYYGDALLAEVKE
jgi:hypothetical protein